jgi:ATP-dependent helicase/nuclease subunit A
VLYVAMTRAKDRLVLVGTSKRNGREQLEESRQFWRNWSGPLPRYLVRYARNPLDWILPAIAAKDATPVFLYPRDVTDAWQAAESTGRLSSTQILAGLDTRVDEPSADAAQAIARLTGTYTYEKLTRIPAITPVTELKGRLDWGDDEQEGPQYASHPDQPAILGGGFGVPHRLRPISPGDAARQKGTATHLFLEKVNLAGRTDRKALGKQLADFVERHLLSQVEADQVDLDGVSWFLNETDLGRHLRRSRSTVRRELPFIMRLEPQWLAPGSGSDDLADAGIVRGVIDVLWATPEGIEIADFKTDAVAGAELRHRIELYKGQLRMYALAIERIWKKPVGRLWLAFLHARHIEPFAPAALKG